MSLSENSASGPQVIHSIGAIADKEGLSSESLFAALECEFAQEIGRRQYGSTKISARIDRKTGDILIRKRLLVVEDHDLEHAEEQFQKDCQEAAIQPENEPAKIVDRKYDGVISSSEAVIRYKSQNHEIGSIVIEHLPPVHPDYLIARSMKPKIEKIINSLVKERQYRTYKERIGTLVIGVVKKSIDLKQNSRSMILDLSGVEAILPSSSLIRGEVFRPGERVKCVIRKVEFSLYKAQVFLSRSSEEFLRELFLQQVPEIYDGIVELKSIARDPGSRAKVAVYSSDRNIDPVGACIGIRGNRINGISAELNGEKIDVVEYSSDVESFLANAIKPIKAIRITVDEGIGKIELVVPDEVVSMIIGRKGQNIRLLSDLLDFRIDAISDTEVSKKRMEEFVRVTEFFMEALNVEEVIAQLLVTEGFTNVQDIAKCDILNLAYIEGFDVNIAEEISKRANDFIEQKDRQIVQLVQKYSVDEIFLKSLPVNEEVAEQLLASGVKSIDDIADLSADDFKEIVGENVVDDKVIERLIMDSRKKLGWL